LRGLLRVSRIIDAINDRLGRLSIWLVVIMVLVGVWNVVGRVLTRYVGRNLTSNALIEVQWYMFSLVFFLGAAYTLLHNGHVRVDVLYARWSGQRRALIDLLGSLLFLMPFAALVIYFSWGSVRFSWLIREGSPDAGGLPRYPIKTLVLVSFALLILQGISEAIKSAAIRTGALQPKEEQRDLEL
jgi:TRAP-type mannitol/chloroaromatic compound transport system permease small subunit